MAKLKAPTQIGGVPIDPRGASAGEGLVFDGAAFTPSPIDPGSGALFLPLSGGVMAGDIDMGGHEIQNVVLPGYLPLAGGAMTGDVLFMNANADHGGAIGAYSSVGRHILMLNAGPTASDTSTARIQLHGGDDSQPGDMSFSSLAGAVLSYSHAGAYVRSYFQLLLPSGLELEPALAFSADGNTGIWRFGADGMALVTGGINRLLLDGSGNVYSDTATRGWVMQAGSGSVSLPVYSFRGDANTGLYSNEADGVYLTAGGVAHLGIAQGTVNAPGVSAATTGTAANVNVSTTGLRILARFTSALKYKSDLTDADYLADIELKPQKFYRKDDDRYFYGFIADWLADQDNLVGTYGEDGDIENYDSPAVMAILAAKVNRLTNRIKELEGSLAS